MGLWLLFAVPTAFAQTDVASDAQTVVVTGSLRALRALEAPYAIGAVSYTHLTLPTNSRV